MKDKEILQKLQVKFNQSLGKFENYFSRPVYKFIYQIVFGIIKSGEVKTGQIAKSLTESISFKKTEERLGHHLGKEGLHKDIQRVHITVHSSDLKRCLYHIVDLTDIQKRYAEKMDGLDRVRDGDKDNIGNGYYLLNITSMDERGDFIVPIYSDLYSLKEEIAGENKKILEAVELVKSGSKKESMFVFDRGMDRKEIMKPLLKECSYFIIRQNGTRNLYYKGKERSLKQISRKVKLHFSYQIKKRKHKKLVTITYTVGAVKVRLPHSKHDLWFVVSKGEGRGYTWYLGYLPPTVKTEKDAVEVIFKGYGFRWKIEEYHRHIKSDFHIEDIRLQRYQALKTMIALFTLAVSFIYSKLDTIIITMFFYTKTAGFYKRKLSEIQGFIYYKLTYAVRAFFNKGEVRLKTPFKCTNKSQIELKFETM